MALCLQGSLLVRHSPPAVADAFCASRLAGDGGLEYGTLPAGSDFQAIIARGRDAGQPLGRASRRVPSRPEASRNRSISAIAVQAMVSAITILFSASSLLAIRGAGLELELDLCAERGRRRTRRCLLVSPGSSGSRKSSSPAPGEGGRCLATAAGLGPTRDHGWKPGS